MTDEKGRTIDYLRVSVTDRCNLRCRYCMPEEGVDMLKHGAILTFEEIVRICRLGVRLGIRKVRITGGEPLVRLGVASLVEQLAGLKGLEAPVMTTNGVLLSNQAEELKRAGLSGVNISLDTLDSRIFQEITRRDAFRQVMEGIDSAQAAGLKVKINCAVTDQISEQEVLQFASFSIERGIPVRFIEMMPIGLGRRYRCADSERLLAALERRYGDVTPSSEPLGYGPAVYFRFGGGSGCIGFIGAVHHRFCGLCNRVRLTSDGCLRLCLDSQDGISLRGLMRGGADDGRLLAVMEEQICRKPAGHHFGEGAEISARNTMNQIGG